MKWLRRIGLVFAGLIALVVIVGIVLFIAGGRKLARTVTADVAPIEIPDDSLSIAEGARYTRIFMCSECHGENLEGNAMIQDPVMGRVVAPHIAPGEGSVTANFAPEDWVRAIRHGIGGDGRPLVIMPASYYTKLVSDVDLANMIAYIRQAPSVDNHPGKSSLRFGQVMLGAGVFKPEYDQIDHSKPAMAKPVADDTLGTGKYLVQICQICHGEDLMGDEEFGGTPLAQGGMLEPYDEGSFREFFRTGITPAGREIDSQRMPWKPFGAMTDQELHALWTYLRTVPATVR